MILHRGSEAEYALDASEYEDALGFTVLHSAVVLPSLEGHLTDKMLRNNFRDINAADRTGTTPLQWACARGDVRSTQLLLDWAASANPRDITGRTALHHALWSPARDCVSIVLRAGVDVIAEDKDGCTAFYYISDANADMIPMFVQHGLRVDHQEKSGETPLHEAARRNQPAVIARLHACGADFTILQQDLFSPAQVAVMFNSTDAVAAFLEYWSSPEVSGLVSVATLYWWSMLILTLEQPMSVPVGLTVYAVNHILRALLMRSVYRYCRAAIYKAGTCSIMQHSSQALKSCRCWLRQIFGE